jgi:hypothetical protein
VSVAVNWGGRDGRGGGWEVRTATVDVGRLYRRRQWLLGHGCGDGGEVMRKLEPAVVCRKDLSRVGDRSSKLQTDSAAKTTPRSTCRAGQLSLSVSTISIQSNTGLIISARPLAKKARADSLLARPGWYNHRPHVPISGPPSNRWMGVGLVFPISRANKQTRAGVYPARLL